VVFASSADELCLVARGTDNSLWYCVYDGSYWDEWTNIFGTTTCDPAVTIFEGKLYVAAICPLNNIWMCSVDLATQAISDWNLWPGTSASNVVLTTSVE
jgi:hypothetical protein